MTLIIDGTKCTTSSSGGVADDGIWLLLPSVQRTDYKAELPSGKAKPLCPRTGTTATTANNASGEQLQLMLPIANNNNMMVAAAAGSIGMLSWRVRRTSSVCF